jgi:hypothetical protein
MGGLGRQVPSPPILGARDAAHGLNSPPVRMLTPLARLCAVNVARAVTQSNSAALTRVPAFAFRVFFAFRVPPPHPNSLAGAGAAGRRSTGWCGTAGALSHAGVRRGGGGLAGADYNDSTSHHGTVTWVVGAWVCDAPTGVSLRPQGTGGRLRAGEWRGESWRGGGGGGGGAGVWRRLARMELPTNSDYDIMLKRGNAQNRTRIAVAGRGGLTGSRPHGGDSDSKAPVRHCAVCAGAGAGVRRAERFSTRQPRVEHGSR